jgi:hypothetical protein
MPKVFAGRISLLFSELRADDGRHSQRTKFATSWVLVWPSLNYRTIGLKGWGSGRPELGRRLPVFQ